ncbi:hypothetical protein V2J56_11660 [Georgenia sp. MJ206]|uniref:hypothetical protein n=1 Tax=Georgenia wangjunii TaxID=3117730 RepID=UPI002F262D1F
MMRRNRTLLVRVGFALLAVLLAVALVLPMAGGAFGATEDATGTSSTAADDPRGPVILIGTAGVRWEDLSAVATPHLWGLAEDGAIANMVVRSVRSSACPADGWLAVSAGRRAADLPTETYGTCRRLENVGPDGLVPGWTDYLDAAQGASYDARPGLLGDLLVEAGVAAGAIGPGAAVALATQTGTVAGQTMPGSPQAGTLARQVSALVPGVELLVVDVGAVRDRGRGLVDDPQPAPEEPTDDGTGAQDDWTLAEPDRTEQVAGVDARVGAVLDALGDADLRPATVLLASLADSGTQPLMQVMAARGGNYPPGHLETRSTRQPGMVQSTDLTPTLAALLALDPPAGLSGAPMSGQASTESGARRIAGLVDENRHAVAIRPLIAPFFTGIVVINLLLYAAVTIGFNRRVLDRASAWLGRRNRSGPLGALLTLVRRQDLAPALHLLRAVSIAVGAIPVASYLANLLPWWRTDSPGLVVFTATACIAALVAGVALARPWRSRVLAPIAVVSGLTVAVLAVDVATGARLQLSALMGVQPQVGGRFYGFNNSSFALWLTATLLLAACLAEPLVRRGRRKEAAAVVAVLGIVATVLNGMPSIGADFGGPPALIPGFALLALLALGVRITWPRMVLVLGGTALAAISFSVLDWLRPADERSHLGRFVETVLDGGLLSVVGRKLEQNLSNLFGSTLTFMAAGGIALVLVVLLQPLRRAARDSDAGAYGWLAQGSSLRRLGADTVMLRPGLVALAVSLGIGFAINDSGVVIPAIGVALAVPLLIAVLAVWLLGIHAVPPAEPGRLAAAEADPPAPAQGQPTAP